MCAASYQKRGRAGCPSRRRHEVAAHLCESCRCQAVAKACCAATESEWDSSSSCSSCSSEDNEEEPDFLGAVEEVRAGGQSINSWSMHSPGAERAQNYS